MCLGTYGGILRVYEAESGVLVQTFVDKIKTDVLLPSKKDASNDSNVAKDETNATSRIVKIIVVKDDSADDNKNKDLKDSASYNNDLVVYVHEFKKPNL